MFYFIYFFVGGGCFVYFCLDCIHICVTLAQRCSHAIWMLRSAPSAPDGNLYGDGRQKRDCSKVRHRNGFQFFFIYLFIFVAAVVVVPALEKSHESEISSIMSRAGRTGIASDSFRWPDVVFIYAVFFFPPPRPSLSLPPRVSGDASYLRQNRHFYSSRTHPATHTVLAWLDQSGGNK